MATEGTEHGCDAGILQRLYLSIKGVGEPLPLLAETYACGAVQLCGLVEGDGVARTCPSVIEARRELKKAAGRRLWTTRLHPDDHRSITDYVENMQPEAVLAAWRKHTAEHPEGKPE